MSIEDKLLRYKRELENTKTNLDRKQGSLESEYSNLCSILELDEDEDQKVIENKANDEVNSLNKRKEKLDKQLNKLIQEIEEELEGDY